MGQQPVPYLSIGPRDTPCQHCGALRWRGERTGLCCADGKVMLDPLPEPPPLLRQLWTADTLEARTFREHARRLNNALALASQKVKEVFPPQQGFSPCVVLQGRLYHQVGPLQAAEGEVPTFAQIYINDPDCDHPEAEAAIRLGHCRLPASTPAPTQRRLLSLLEQLQLLLREVNPFVQDFLHAAELPEDEVRQANLIISAEARPANQHPRRYNRSEGWKEVTVLIDEQPGHQDIVLRRRPDREGPYLQIINETHRAFEPLHFVLLFPEGTTGWHPQLQQARPGNNGQVRTVTALQYYAHRLQIRPVVDDSMLRACRLLQEYCCSGFARVETQRLLYLARNQAQIRAEVYQHLRDAVAGDHLEDGAAVLGRQVILPATFVGGPRYMHKR